MPIVAVTPATMSVRFVCGESTRIRHFSCTRMLSPYLQAMPVGTRW